MNVDSSSELEISTGILYAESCPFSKRKEQVGLAQVHSQVIRVKPFKNLNHFKIISIVRIDYLFAFMDAVVVEGFLSGSSVKNPPDKQKMWV